MVYNKQCCLQVEKLSIYSWEQGYWLVMHIEYSCTLIFHQLPIPAEYLGHCLKNTIQNDTQLTNHTA